MVTIFSGKIGSGKTTRLWEWSKKGKSVGGILMPLVSGKRYFYSVSSGETYQAEIDKDEYNGEIVNIGRYSFSDRGFIRANGEIIESFQKYKNIIIDEIGPLELFGKGFYYSLKNILENKKSLNNKNLIIVIREGMIEKIVDYFNLENYSVVRKVSEIFSTS